MSQRLIGKDLESYADYRVKDLPVTVLGRIVTAVNKTFNALWYICNPTIVFLMRAIPEFIPGRRMKNYD
jgi:hypothetical protein